MFVLDVAGVTVRWGRHRTAHAPTCYPRLFNSNSFATSAALPEVCAMLSAVQHRVHKNVSQRLFLAITLEVVHRFPSSLARRYSNECRAVCIKTVHFT